MLLPAEPCRNAPGDAEEDRGSGFFTCSCVRQKPPPWPASEPRRRVRGKDGGQERPAG
jgi:hypothetical protein